MSNTIQSRKLHPAFLAQQLNGEPVLSSPTAQQSPPPSLLSHLRDVSQQAGVERPANDDEVEFPPSGGDSVFKQFLGHRKLVANLLSTVLENGQDAVTELHQAADWVSQQVSRLECQLSDKGIACNDYHRYELAKLFTELVQQKPDLRAAPLPDALITELSEFASQPPNLLTQTAAAPYQSTQPNTDIAMAWGRALSSVMNVVQRCHFNREPADLLNHAQQHLSQAVESKTQAIYQQLGNSDTLSSEQQTVVALHSLSTSTQVYTAIMERLYDESVAAINEYKAAVMAERVEHADALALDYQKRQLGYDGLAPRFEQALQQLDQINPQLQLSKTPAAKESSFPAP